MSRYTTGELAKLCGVSVRTVQYYDTRGILTPSELTEGGRRLYSQEDVKRLKLICFLREMEIPINQIGELLSDPEPRNVIALLLEQQEEVLQKEIIEKQKKLNCVEEIKKELRNVKEFSVEMIGDIALYNQIAYLQGKTEHLLLSCN
jgi:DNA-binding transcriptional MerR regulator